MGRTHGRVLLAAREAREVGPWVGEQKPLGKTLLRGNPSPEMTYLSTCHCRSFDTSIQITS